MVVGCPLFPFVVATCNARFDIRYEDTIRTLPGFVLSVSGQRTEYGRNTGIGFGGLLLWLAYCQSCASDVHETGTSICNQQSIMVLLNLDASPIKDQVASVVLDLQGNVVTASPSTDHPAIDSTATKLLYQIFLEAGSLQLPSFRRMVLSSSSSSSSSSSTSSLLMKDNTGTDVAVGDIRYILTRDDAYIYIVAQKEP